MESTTDAYASFRHLVKVFLPITLSLLSGALLLFIDRVFISHYSLESLEACATAASICMFLQVPFMRVTSMTNPMVGNLLGGNQRAQVGTAVWQMIWFAFLSTLITLPLGILAIHFVLQKTFIEALTIQYLQILLPFNFTFALGVALSSFFIAIGRRWIVVGTTLLSHVINVTLNYLLIFGVRGVIPSLGIRGAAIGTIAAQIVFCALLFVLFQSTNHTQLYHTRRFQFHGQQFLKILKKWGLFGITKLVLLFYWLIITRIMLMAGGSATLVLSIGCTIFGSLIFLNDGLNQAIITCAAHILGAKTWHGIWKLVRASFLLLGCIGGILAIPCLLFREQFLHFFIHTPLQAKDFSLLMTTCIWMWCFFIGEGTTRIFQSFIFASGDSRFNLMYQLVFELLLTVIPTYFLIRVWGVSPDKVWMLLSITAILNTVCYLLRVRRNYWGKRFLRTHKTCS